MRISYAIIYEVLETPASLMKETKRKFRQLIFIAR